MIEIFEKLFHYVESACAGLIGAIIAVQFHPDVSGRKDVFVFIITGTMIAHFMTGIVSAYFRIDPASYGAVGFMLGAFGGSLFSAITKAIRSADLWSLIAAKFGGKND